MADNGVQKYSEYDHHDPAITLENVHESWDTLRAQCPIGRSDAYGGMWVVTGFPRPTRSSTSRRRSLPPR